MYILCCMSRPVGSAVELSLLWCFLCTFCVVCHVQWTARWSCHYHGVSYVHFVLYVMPSGQRGWALIIVVFLMYIWVVCHAQWTARLSCHYCGIYYVTFYVVCHVQWAARLSCHYYGVSYVYFVLYVTSSGQRGWVVIIMVFLMYILCCMSRPVDSAVALSLLWCFLSIFCVVCHVQWTARLSCHYYGVSYVHFVLYVSSSRQRGWVVIILVFLMYILCCMSRPVDSPVELSLLWCFLCTFCVVCHAQWTARLSSHCCGVSYVYFVLYVTSSGQRGWVVIIMVFLMYILCCMSRPVDSAVELSLLWCFLCIFCVVCHVQLTARLSCHYYGVSYVHFVLYVTPSGQRGWALIIVVFLMYILCCMSRPVDSAVELSHAAVMNNMGANCCAGSRTYVHRDIYEEFVKKSVQRATRKTVGDPYDFKNENGAQVFLYLAFWLCIEFNVSDTF